MLVFFGPFVRLLECSAAAGMTLAYNAHKKGETRAGSLSPPRPSHDFHIVIRLIGTYYTVSETAVYVYIYIVYGIIIIIKIINIVWTDGFHSKPSPSRRFLETVNIFRCSRNHPYIVDVEQYPIKYVSISWVLLLIMTPYTLPVWWNW